MTRHRVAPGRARGVPGAIAIVVGVALAVLVGVPGRAAAYPQLLSPDDPTCTSCHLSPAGGNLLNENGLMVAEAGSQLGTAPEFFYGKVPTPDWLALGGDFRASTGFISTPEKVLATFPMQLELYGAATFGQLSVHANVGGRPAQEGHPATGVGSREHYVMWQQQAGGTAGAYVRAGRFMPVIGLRLAEHTAYTRRHGGTPLFADTYGVHAAYVTPSVEAHLTGFVEDPLIDPVDHSNGIAAYAEVQVSDALRLGGLGMVQDTEDDKKVRAGVTGRLYLSGPQLLLQGELQFVNQLIDTTPTNPAGGAPKQLVGYLLASRKLTDYVLVDLGLGHFDANLRIADVDRDAVDVNVHYFLTSHVEVALNTRLQTIGFTDGGPTSGYALVQLHYRL